MKIILSIMLLLSAADSTSTIAKSFGDHILNGLDSVFFYACIFAGYVGYFLRLWWGVDYAVKSNPRTPGKFDKDYFWSNNFQSILRDVFTIPFVILFYPQLLNLFLTWAEQVDLLPEWAGKLFDNYSVTTVFTSLAVGALFKWVASRLRAWKYKRKKSATENKGGL